MSFRSKGTFGSTVIVSRYPDESGNLVCDGTTDDVEIQAAIDRVITLGGGRVKLLDGTYSISAIIDLDDNVDFCGVGPTTILQNVNDDATAHVLRANGILATHKTNIAVHDLQIDGNSKTGHCVAYIYTDDSSIYNTVLRDAAWYGGGFDKGYGCSAHKNVVYSNGDGGLFTDAGYGNYFTENTVTQNALTGAGPVGGIVLAQGAMEVGERRDHIVSNNVVDGNLIGIVLNNTDWSIVTGNLIKNSTSVSGQIDLEVCNHNLVQNNIMRVGAGRGVRINDSDYNNISLNTIYDHSASHGINLVGSSAYNSIIGNIIDDAWIGINEQNTSDYNLLFRNVFNNVGSSAVAIVGTNTKTPYFWAFPLNPDTTIGDHPAQQMVDNVDTYIHNQVYFPLEFQELVTAQIVVVQGTGVNPNMVWTCDTDWGKICSAEDYLTHSDTIGSTTSALAQDDLVCLDISTALDGVAAGDLVGVSFMRDGDNGADNVGGTVYYLGIRVRYV